MPAAAANTNPFANFQPATALYHPDNAIALARAARLAYQGPADVASMGNAITVARTEFPVTVQVR